MNISQNGREIKRNDAKAGLGEGKGAEEDHRAAEDIVGLTSQQVSQREAAGWTNKRPPDPTKSLGRILREHAFTLFNGVNLIVALCLFAVGAYHNMLFLGVVLSATAIGLFQELRAKHTLARLQILTAPSVCVQRDGKERSIPAEALVQDDLVWLGLGDQVPADGEIVSGELLVDESLLTGEADAIRKSVGDEVLSGSVIVSGRAAMRALRVGAAAYSVDLSQQARRHKRIQSAWMKALDKLIRWISVLIAPVGLLLFASQYYLNHSTLYDAVVGASAGVIGMIPEGLVLLVFMTYAVGAMRLARRRVLVQTLPCIETLARVDVLCLDKTGTITTGNMRVQEVVPLADECEAHRALALLAWALPAMNPTSRALQAHCAHLPEADAARHIAHFSSATKWSGAQFDRTYILGAASFVLPDLDDALAARIRAYAETGLRVVLLCASDEDLPGDGALPGGLSPLALVLIGEEVRATAADTFAYFASQDVALKIISGDSADTVKAVAAQAGFPDAEALDMSQVAEGQDLAALARRYMFFGRVSPAQKKALVEALQAEGHTVGMTGDGVNDVLALKQADCSIAMAGGSAAVRGVAELVLLDSDFSSLVGVVNEGRRAVNNMMSVSTLYLVKTVYSMCLAAIFTLLHQPYPFTPIHLTLIGALMTGVPSFLLALQPNTKRVSRDVLGAVIRTALPAGLTIAAVLIALEFLSGALRLGTDQLRTINALVTGVVTWTVLVRASAPLTGRKIALVAASLALFLLAIVGMWRFFRFAPPFWGLLTVGVPAAIVAALLIGAMRHAVDAVLRWRGRRREARA